MSSEKFIQNKLALTTLICACVVVLMSLSVRQVFGMFFIDFNNDLGISNTEFGLAIGIQMLGWGLSGPIFGVLADKYGGHKSIIIAFLFYILGVYFLYAGPNTGIYFQISLGVLIGIGCGGTAISIPMSIVGKHFPLSNRTIAMSIVTAVGSFGYFLSPLFTNYSLQNNGWVNTLFYFMIFLSIGLIFAYFVRSPQLDKANDADYIKQLGNTGIIFAVGSIASWLRIYCLGTSTERISCRLRKLLFNCYMDKDIEFFDQQRDGELYVTLSHLLLECG